MKLETVDLKVGSLILFRGESTGAEIAITLTDEAETTTYYNLVIAAITGDKYVQRNQLTTDQVLPHPPSVHGMYQLVLSQNCHYSGTVLNFHHSPGRCFPNHN